jgi:hypothetical protein
VRPPSPDAHAASASLGVWSFSNADRGDSVYAHDLQIVHDAGAQM